MKRLPKSAVAAAICLCALIGLGGCAPSAAPAGDQVDVNAIDPAAEEGQASYKTEGQKQAAAEAEQDANKFNIAIASRIEFDSADGTGLAYIENAPKNAYNMQVTITDEQTGDVLYRTGIIEPNHHIDSIKLDRTLDTGEHRVLARFTALDPQTGEEAGQAGAIVTLVIP